MLFRSYVLCLFIMYKQVLGLFVLGIVLISVSYYGKGEESVSLSLIAYKVNRNRNATWKATREVYKSLVMDRPRFGLIDDEEGDLGVSQPPVHNGPVPESFDARVAWPGCPSFLDIYDQSNCASCWAIAATSSMSDRICIQSDQKDTRRLSAEDLLECCKSCGYGCYGGTLMGGWRYWKKHGIVTGGPYNNKSYCKPYIFEPCNHANYGPYAPCEAIPPNTPTCRKECENGYKTEYRKDRVFGESFYKLVGEEAIKAEIVNNGSVQAGMSVFEDLLVYKSGVYQHLEGNFIGGHAVKIIGYGIEKGVKYWLIANSWNDTWGENGFFKILRGEDHCGIENGVVAGLPIQ